MTDTMNLAPRILRDVVETYHPTRALRHDLGDLPIFNSYVTDTRYKWSFFDPDGNRLLSINFDSVWKAELHASHTMLDRGAEPILREARDDAAQRIEALSCVWGWSSILSETKVHKPDGVRGLHGLHALVSWRGADREYSIAAHMLAAMRDAALDALLRRYAARSELATAA